MDSQTQITRISTSYQAPTISDNTLTNGLGYLSDGFDNSNDWKLEFKYYVTNIGAGFLLLPTGITVRDKYFVQIWEDGLIVYKNPNTNLGSQSLNPRLGYNQWHTVKITKENSTVTVYINDAQLYQNTISTINDYDVLYIGLDYMNRGGASSIKDIKIKPL